MPTAVTAVPSVHYATIERRIPTWLKQAPPETQSAMRNWHQAPAWLATAIQQQPEVAKAWQEEHARHREHQVQVHKLFEKLPTLEAYATKTLTEAIKQRFRLDLDVRNTYLVDARQIETTNAIDSRQAVDRATRSLLHCALHNFDQDAAADHGMDAPASLLKRSVIVDHRRFMGTVPINNALDIAAEDFADLCRTLDIGGKYHQQVHAIYYPAATPPLGADEAALAVYETLGRAEVSAFRQSLHLARLKGDISEALYSAALATPLDQAPSPSSPVTFSLLDLWEAELTGVVLITLQAEEHQAVALYIPEDSTTPLKEFASQEAMNEELRDRLQADIGYLDKHLADRDKAPITTRLKDRLMPLAWSVRGLHERVPDPHATLYPVKKPFSHAFQGVMTFQKTQRHEKDVLFHATPTEIVDRRTAQAHRELIAGRVLTALNIAGFFVPGLGEAMLAVCLAQLAHEVYEGIDAWENDERDTAYGYLVDVIENVAVMAALSAVAKALRGSQGSETGTAPEGPEIEEPEDEEPGIPRIPVETPSFIEELEVVETSDGQMRLWKPDLTPYQSHETLPHDLVPDELGLRHHQGKRWLVLQGNQYIVSQTPTTGEYRLQHPASPRRYQPPVRHNGAGAWLHVTDKPLSWSGMTLLRRIGHLSGHFDEPTLQRIIAVSGVHEDELRRALAESQRLPALLEDTLQRFKLDETVRQLADESTRPAEFARAYAGLSHDLAPGAEAIQRAYPKLPSAVANELAREASALELQMLDSGKVPLRLGEEARVYQQQIRLARTCEGLYLSSVPSWDSDLLIMHTLERLPGWPVQTRLRLLQRMSWPTQDHAIGTPGTRPYTTITHAPAGYIVHDESLPSAVVKVYPSLYAALYEALPAAMASMDVTDQQALQRLVQESPLLPRPALRVLLGMQPVRPGYRSPMRLADGRLGYPLSGGGPATHGITRQRLLEAIEATGLATRTGRSADQILLALASRGRTQLQIFEHLQTLVEQRNELQSSLDDWSEAISPASDQAAHDYDSLRDSIMQHWYETALEESAEPTTELRIARVPLADVPLTLPAFFNTRVRSLSLIDLPSGSLAGWAQNERLLQRLLRQMPQIESLEISRAFDPRATPSPFLFSVPTITECLPALQRLVLTNQNMTLSESDLNLLSGLRQLRYLDLSGNRLAQSNRPSFHELTLDYLGLDQMQLAQWPIGIGSDALARISHLSLRHNNLRSLPSFLLHEADMLTTPPVISLEGNSINESHLQRLLLNERVDTSGITTDQPEALSEQLARIRDERRQMRDAIDGWAQASSSSNPLTQAALADRQRIASAIGQFWEQQEQGQSYLRLQLEDVAIEHFPRRLPAFFGARVRALSLTRLRGSASQLDELLSRFPNISRLTIDEHQAAMPSLASALARLPQLTFLEFRNMGLEVDQAMLDIFAGLRNLTSLDLSGNRMGSIDRVPASLASNLQSLALTNMNLQAWPNWCDSLLPLELLDLSSNNITQLPEHILSNLNNPMPISSIALFDNPLPLETILRVRTFSDSQHSYSFALDIPDDLMFFDTSSEGSLDHPHFPLLGDDTPRLEDWMLGNEAQNAALRECWEQLEGSDLLRLTGRLHNAAPYVDPNTRTTFCERVRIMLVVAASNETERPIMESIAAAALPDPATGSQTCHDGALQEFNNIELYLMSQRLLIDAGDSLQALRRRLLQLFRVEQLELMANQRTGTGDRVSVRLAYRRELAKELDLPIADSMRFRGAANLARDELSSVLEKVRKSELSDALVDYMLANTDWTTRLRAEFADRFAEIEARFRLRVLELASKDHSLQDELNLQQGLQDDKDQEERELLRELTIKQINNN
ncbi:MULTISPECIES: dermonecrotic toxin domain-containing protein [Pseudomonas]|uniref:RING-type E3 ubiquitin transferase n=3 Tax=Pseudomonas TaxID=286 RepID=A0AAJ5HXH8_9PSED|nr:MULTISPECIES: DUF6543 domain-containing protein [Pseudomonas]MDM9598281.1 NEL-type E3 ubiquitin ligase domain-containing protein [Pseudomonas shirazica]MDO2411709.1 NEL-type E3 ubiquitin ligase domain-containing protein [Pseudomonas shirazica]MDS9588095.1 NEL-type E3 ubiquitin ligase domain-containing protein [Pseudomonas sp. HTZ1]UUC18457.1 hypothetical protein NOV18_24940 [Pseudomonas asiatica]